MRTRPAGKTALISGATSTTGRATTMAFPADTRALDGRIDALADAGITVRG